MRRWATVTAIAALAMLVLAGGGGAQPAIEDAPRPGPYENAGDSFLNVLPPGQNGHARLDQVIAFVASGGERGRPEHNDDQLAMYGDLVYASPELSRSRLGTFFKDASFGVPRGQVEEQYQPCGTAADPCEPRLDDHPCTEVTVQRDAGFGVPHIYGGTRAGAMCAAGYVAAEDRLFLIDALRHAGLAQLSSFAGGAEGNRAMDRAQWSIAPYRQRDLSRQITQFDDLYGREGRKLQRDLEAYVAGLNQYVFEARLDPARKLPGEYAAIIGPPDEEDSLESAVRPERFEGTDIVAIASLVGGIFGKGGGQELDSALFLEAAQDRFGPSEGEEVWSDFRSAEDPEAPTTVLGRSFPYQVRPGEPAAGSLALPDPGSLRRTGVRSEEDDPGGFLDGLLPPGSFPPAGSNALLVSGRESSSGHPLAVFGPQTGYFSPQLLMEMDIHGPGIDARGAAFAGTNLYVQLGRGVDYAWSATSAGQDNVDTFALDLCDPEGGDSSITSRGYRYRGRCHRFEVLKRTNRWTPNAADQTPPGSETLRMRRTKLGLEVARATVDGDPVVYVQLRSTYLHEVDSARGFARFNDPDAIRGPRDYQRAAHQIGYTFNWLYADDRDIAYFNSGENPERPDGIDPNFPVRACPTAACEFEWRGYQPIRSRGKLTGNRARYTPFEEHPQIVNQRFLTSWNNKQAPGYRASDGNFEYHSLYRSIPLDERIREGISGGRTMTLVELIDAMEDAGTVDLRGDQVLPWLLQVLDSGSATPAGASDGGEAGAAADETAPSSSDAEASSRQAREADLAEESCEELGVDTVEKAIPLLEDWSQSGAHRRDSDGDEIYAHSCAIQIMDAWWPLLVEGVFKPTLGGKLYNRRLALGGIDNEPNNDGAHLGSAYQGGWYGYVEKDLRTILGERVRGRYSRLYCGGEKNQEGSLADCRAVLEASLTEALGVPREALYGDDPVCDDHDDLDPQYCFDAVWHRPVGAITQPLIHWINRPTFQQAVEVQRSVPRDGGPGGPPAPREQGDDGPGGGPGGDGGGAGSGPAGTDALSPGAAAGAGRAAGSLPFTGLALAALVALGLSLLAAGLIARRR